MNSALTFASALAADAEIAALLAQPAEIAAMLAFESALAAAQAQCGLIPAAAAAAIATACTRFQPDLAGLAAGLRQDGVLGPAFITALRQSIAEPHARHLHFGATSQDVTDTALTLRLKPVLGILQARLAALVAALENLQDAQGEVAIMAHTRMQQALPFTAGDKIASWLQPLRRHQQRLVALGPHLLVVQLGGPVGTRAELQGKGNLVAAALAARLGLGDAPCWHTARDNIVELGQLAALICGATGKLGADTALLAQTEIAALAIAGAGKSSAMAHKANPVTAELLVTLARYANGLAAMLGSALVHENERSGAAWTLEWLALPPLLSATGASLAQATDLVCRMTFLPNTESPA